MDLKTFLADTLQEFDDRHTNDVGDSIRQYEEDRRWLVTLFNL